MDFSEVLSNLTRLGQYINKSLSQDPGDKHNDLLQVIHCQHPLNNWHTEEDIIDMLRHLGSLLSEEKISIWTKNLVGLDASLLREPILIKANPNYSFAGIQEWLCCLVTQTPMVLNANENQYQILKFLCQKLVEFNNHWKDYFDVNLRNTLKPEKYLIYIERKNDSAYQYFKSRKSVLIEHRPTIAILTGEETTTDLTKFGKDIFMHLGQSNRTLRKIFIPESFEIKKLIEALEPYSKVYSNNKYANNYDYHQSVYLMNKIPFLDNGFLIFKEDLSNDAPTGCLFYEYYSNKDLLLEKLLEIKYENLICAEELPLKTIRPGESNFFNLADYPNRKNLIEFLLNP